MKLVALTVQCAFFVSQVCMAADNSATAYVELAGAESKNNAAVGVGPADEKKDSQQQMQPTRQPPSLQAQINALARETESETCFTRGWVATVMLGTAIVDLVRRTLPCNTSVCLPDSQDMTGKCYALSTCAPYAKRQVHGAYCPMKRKKVSVADIKNNSISRLVNDCGCVKGFCVSEVSCDDLDCPSFHQPLPPTKQSKIAQNPATPKKKPRTRYLRGN